MRVGHYEIEGTLGGSSTGTIYLAEDVHLRRRVALRQVSLSVESLASDEARARFLGAARFGTQLNHPNIVQAYDVVENGESLYVAMELVIGATLASMMPPGRVFPPGQAVSIVTQIAQGLAHAHARGAIDRNLDPSNIFVLPDGCVKISGLGIPVQARNPPNIPTGILADSWGYMAPEQVQGLPATPATDLFALGCVLYQLLTGSRPFAGDSPQELVYRIVHAEPIPPRQLNPVLSVGLEQVVLRCLHKEPASRFPSMEAFLGELHRAMAGRTPGGVPTVLPGQPPPAGEVGAPLPRSMMWAVVGLITVCLVALVIVAWGARGGGWTRQDSAHSSVSPPTVGVAGPGPDSSLSPSDPSPAGAGGFQPPALAHPTAAVRQSPGSDHGSPARPPAPTVAPALAGAPGTPEECLTRYYQSENLFSQSGDEARVRMGYDCLSTAWQQTRGWSYPEFVRKQRARRVLTQISSLRTVATSATARDVVAVLVYKTLSGTTVSRVTIRYHMVHERGGWRMDEGQSVRGSASLPVPCRVTGGLAGTMEQESPPPAPYHASVMGLLALGAQSGRNRSASGLHSHRVTRCALQLRMPES